MNLEEDLYELGQRIHARTGADVKIDVDHYNRQYVCEWRNRWLTPQDWIKRPEEIADAWIREILSSI